MTHRHMLEEILKSTNYEFISPYDAEKRENIFDESSDKLYIYFNNIEVVFQFDSNDKCHRIYSLTQKSEQ